MSMAIEQMVRTDIETQLLANIGGERMPESFDMRSILSVGTFYWKLRLTKRRGNPQNFMLATVPLDVLLGTLTFAFYDDENRIKSSAIAGQVQAFIEGIYVPTPPSPGDTGIINYISFIDSTITPQPLSALIIRDFTFLVNYSGN